MKKPAKPTFRLAVLLAALLVAVTGTVTPAQAASRSVIGTGNYEPWLYFQRNASSPLNSPLTMYFSIGGTRYASTVRAGSGNGSTNDCLTNRGWLPAGHYESIPHYRKTWGNATVQGWVWELGNKPCSNGSVTRTELFIHSSGIEGTAWNGNYATEGCIKISQVDRADFGSWWRSSYASSSGDLEVGNL